MTSRRTDPWTAQMHLAIARRYLRRLGRERAPFWRSPGAAAGGAWPILATAGQGQGSAQRFSGISLALALVRDSPGRPLNGNGFRAGIAASLDATACVPIRDSALHAEMSGADIALPHSSRESRDAAANSTGAERTKFRALPPQQPAELTAVAYDIYRKFAAWLKKKGFMRHADADETCENEDALASCLRGSLGIGQVVELDEAGDVRYSQEQADEKRFALHKSPHAGEFGGFSIQQA